MYDSTKIFWKLITHLYYFTFNIFSWLCTRPDGSKFLEAIVFSRLFAFIRKCLDEAAIDGSTMRDGENNAQPGFVYKGKNKLFSKFNEIFHMYHIIIF